MRGRGPCKSEAVKRSDDITTVVQPALSSPSLPYTTSLQLSVLSRKITSTLVSTQKV